MSEIDSNNGMINVLLRGAYREENEQLKQQFATVTAERDQLRQQVEQLRLVMENIVEPMAYLQHKAEKNGVVLSRLAPKLCQDVEWIKSFARQALAELRREGDK